MLSERRLRWLVFLPGEAEPIAAFRFRGHARGYVNQRYPGEYARVVEEDEPKSLPKNPPEEPPCP